MKLIKKKHNAFRVGVGKARMALQKNETICLQTLDPGLDIKSEQTQVAIAEMEGWNSIVQPKSTRLYLMRIKRFGQLDPNAIPFWTVSQQCGLVKHHLATECLLALINIQIPSMQHSLNTILTMMISFIVPCKIVLLSTKLPCIN